MEEQNATAIIQYMERQNLSGRRMAEILGVPTASFARYVSQRKFPESVIDKFNQLMAQNDPHGAVLTSVAAYTLGQMYGFLSRFDQWLVKCVPLSTWMNRPMELIGLMGQRVKYIPYESQREKVDEAFAQLLSNLDLMEIPRTYGVSSERMGDFTLGYFHGRNGKVTPVIEMPTNDVARGSEDADM